MHKAKVLPCDIHVDKTLVWAAEADGWSAVTLNPEEINLGLVFSLAPSAVICKASHKDSPTSVWRTVRKKTNKRWVLKNSGVLALAGWHYRPSQTGGLSSDTHLLTGCHCSQFWRGPSSWLTDGLKVHLLTVFLRAYTQYISPHFLKQSHHRQSWQITALYLWPCLPLIALFNFCLQIQSPWDLELQGWIWVRHSPFNGRCLNDRCLNGRCLCFFSVSVIKYPDKSTCGLF